MRTASNLRVHTFETEGSQNRRETVDSESELSIQPFDESLQVELFDRIEWEFKQSSANNAI